MAATQEAPPMNTSSGRRLSTESTWSSTASVCRSRAWSEDIQKHWVLPVLSSETLEQRFARYSEYFSLTSVQIRRIYNEVFTELEAGCQAHRDGTSRPDSVLMLDTFITRMPTGAEKGVAYVLDFSSNYARAIRARLEGQGRISTAERRQCIDDINIGHPKGLMDERCGAKELFDFLGELITDLVSTCSDPQDATAAAEETSSKLRDTSAALLAPLAFSIGFPVKQNSIKSARLIEWTKGFETGRATADKVEKSDLVSLLDMALWRLKANNRVSVAVNNVVSTLLACAYEKPAKLPPCTVSLTVANGLNGAYVEPKAKGYGYKGVIINTEIGNFGKCLPVTDVDLEVDFADDGGHGTQTLEKMVAGSYLGEVCRRLILKVYQSEAPSLAWSRHSLPATAAALCVSDKSEDLVLVQKLLMGLWDWPTSLPTRRMVQQLISLVFRRSAGIVAIIIAAMAKKSGRLQPAMGGLTVGIDGAAQFFHSWYTDLVREYLNEVLGKSTGDFIHIYIASDAVGKGAAVLARMMKD